MTNIKATLLVYEQGDRTALVDKLPGAIVDFKATSFGVLAVFLADDGGFYQAKLEDLIADEVGNERD